MNHIKNPSQFSFNKTARKIWRLMQEARKCQVESEDRMMMGLYQISMLCKIAKENWKFSLIANTPDGKEEYLVTSDDVVCLKDGYSGIDMYLRYIESK